MTQQDFHFSKYYLRIEPIQIFDHNGFMRCIKLKEERNLMTQQFTTNESDKVTNGFSQAKGILWKLLDFLKGLCATTILLLFIVNTSIETSMS